MGVRTLRGEEQKRFPGFGVKEPASATAFHRRQGRICSRGRPPVAGQAHEPPCKVAGTSCGTGPVKLREWIVRDSGASFEPPQNSHLNFLGQYKPQDCPLPRTRARMHTRVCMHVGHPGACPEAGGQPGGGSWPPGTAGRKEPASNRGLRQRPGHEFAPPGVLFYDRWSVL